MILLPFDGSSSLPNSFCSLAFLCCVSQDDSTPLDAALKQDDDVEDVSVVYALLKFGALVSPAHVTCAVHDGLDDLADTLRSHVRVDGDVFGV